MEELQKKHLTDGVNFQIFQIKFLEILIYVFRRAKSHINI